MPKAKFTKKQKEVLGQLESAARKAGLRISYGNLRFAGLKLKSGQCLFRGEKWLVMDRRQPYEDQLEVFRTALSEYDFADLDLGPAADRVLGTLFRLPNQVLNAAE